MKKNATTILTESRDLQNFLDSLAQTVENFKDSSNGDDFDYATRASIMDEVVASINNLRTIEQQLMTRIGQSYTNTPYTAFDFIVKVPVPQFLHVQEVQQFYNREIARVLEKVTRDEVETFFVDDGLGQGTNQVVPPSTNPRPIGNTPNIIYLKEASAISNPWNDAENAIITSLGVMQSTLMGDVPNVS